MTKSQPQASRRKPGARKKDDAQVPFAAALERLEEIVATLESGEPSLEESLALFEEGVGLSRGCHRGLDEAEQRLELLVQKADGSLDSEPFPDKELFPSADGEGNVR